MSAVSDTSCILRPVYGRTLWHTLRMVEDTSKSPAGNESDADSDEQSAVEAEQRATAREKEIGGRGGLDPTRYGDWEKAGRCIDF